MKVVSPQESYVQIFEIEKVTPLESQIGVWPKKTFPDELYPALFGPVISNKEDLGQREIGESLKTYAILDGAKIPHLSLLLNNSGLPYESLFKGKAKEKYKDVSAYIVQLSEDNEFTRSLFTSSEMPSSLWDKNAAIFLRSQCSLVVLQDHFRKFLRLYSEESGTWRLFRFYAPETLRTIVAAFNKQQFETFSQGINLMACTSANGGFIVLADPEQELNWT